MYDRHRVDVIQDGLDNPERWFYDTSVSVDVHTDNWKQRRFALPQTIDRRLDRAPVCHVERVR